MKYELYNRENESVGEITLPDSVFASPWRPALVKQVLTAQLNNKRTPWAHAKTRAEVRGGGRKPWRQKGTGRARHGSIRSPLWRKGGKAHGPLSTRDYSEHVNKKMKRVALFSVLSKRLAEKRIKIFDNLDTEAPKTKMADQMLRKLLNVPKRKKNLDVLIVAGKSKNLARASANLEKAKVLAPGSLNVYDLMNYEHIFIDQSAVERIEAHYKI